MHAFVGGGSLPITVDRIRKTYGSFAALDGVSLEVARGEFLTLLGPSGSGKTTLLMVLAGFIRPDSGRVHFGGTEVTLTPPHRRGIGMVFQNYALFPHMNVAGNLAYPLKLRGFGRSELNERVRRALDVVQLSDFGDRQVDQLSGGQRQRVALARAIIFEPRILLMDEPLSALDKKLREQMQIEVRHLHQRLGITTVYVTHDQREALTMSDRIAIIEKGRFQQIGTPREIYEQPRSRFVADFIGESHFLPVSVSNGVAAFGGTPLKLARAPQGTSALQYLVLRPEKLRILGDVPAAETVNLFRGHVQELVYQGESVLVYVTMDGGSTVAVRHMTAAANRSPVVGEPVTLALSCENAVVVAAEET
jgi:putative spermidine/putrescine transport system ATP-binding protein